MPDDQQNDSIIEALNRDRLSQESRGTGPGEHLKAVPDPAGDPADPIENPPYDEEIAGQVYTLITGEDSEAPRFNDLDIPDQVWEAVDMIAQGYQNAATTLAEAVEEKDMEKFYGAAASFAMWEHDTMATVEATLDLLSRLYAQKATDAHEATEEADYGSGDDTPQA